jgi:ankyrin repeat protein
LHAVPENGRPDAIPLLLERGANINAQDCARQTPLSVALVYGKLEVARLLLERGANVKFTGHTEANSAPYRNKEWVFQRRAAATGSWRGCQRRKLGQPNSPIARVGKQGAGGGATATTARGRHEY